MPSEIACCLVMGANAYYYLTPISQSEHTSRLWIIRPRQVTRGQIPNTEYVPVAEKPLIWRLLQMLGIALRLGRRKEIRAFTSINPIPYGLIQLPAARLYGKPIHFGFVGSDWYRHAKGRSGRWLRPLLKAADFYTCTGPKMRQQMIDYGLDEEKIAILPHAIDLENYPRNDPQRAEYTCIFVGALIKRKRIDVILRGFALAQGRRPEIKLLIVGDGPLAGYLLDLASELGIGESVTFAGFQEQVQPYLVNSMLLVMASDMEGLPFALIEGMVSGLVPISTPVGTIEDLIVDEKNGLLFPQGDHQGLARRIESLLEDEDYYHRLRSETLKVRETHSFAAATAVWDRWFEALDNPGANQR